LSSERTMLRADCKHAYDPGVLDALSSDISSLQGPCELTATQADGGILVRAARAAARSRRSFGMARIVSITPRMT